MNKYDFNGFMDIIRTLRGENGCPWDREQTHESLKPCLIEECYETVEAINNADKENLCEELGDILLQVALHTAIAEENGDFTIEDVIEGVALKMIRRHPHVFGDTVVHNSEGVLKNWEEIKRQEKNEKSVSESILKVPKVLPANIRAQKIQKKVAKVGFEFRDYDQVFYKVQEALMKLEKARKNGRLDEVEEEFGDFMFAVINLSRFLQLNAENSLTNATNKFINRFVDVERLAECEGRHLNQMSIDELNELWGKAKITN